MHSPLTIQWGQEPSLRHTGAKFERCARRSAAATFFLKYNINFTVERPKIKMNPPAFDTFIRCQTWKLICRRDRSGLFSITKEGRCRPDLHFFFHHVSVSTTVSFDNIRWAAKLHRALFSRYGRNFTWSLKTDALWQKGVGSPAFKPTACLFYVFFLWVQTKIKSFLKALLNHRGNSLKKQPPKRPGMTTTE